MTVHGGTAGAVGLVVTDGWVVGDDGACTAQEGSGPVLYNVVGVACALDGTADSVVSQIIMAIRRAVGIALAIAVGALAVEKIVPTCS